MKRRAFLGGGAVALAGLPACANPPPTSTRPDARPEDWIARTTPGADRIVAEANLGSRAQVGFALVDARTGAPVETGSPLRALPPASVLKAVTALYALEAMGAGHRFQTRLIATGPIRNGRLEGDLVLVGGGDPSLDTDGLHALAADARAAGLSEVGGRLLVHPGPLRTIERIDRAQPEHVGYNPAVSGLNLNFNRVHFSWARGGSGYTTAMDARTDRFRPGVSTSRMRIADRSLPVYTYADADGIDAWTVARRQLGGSGSRWLPVRNPLLYAGDVMRTMLRANGVAAPAAARASGGVPQGTVIAVQQGASLDRVASAMLKFSNNLTAEVLGLSASAARGAPTRSLGASAGAMSTWLGATTGARRPDFDDHSGLNGTSRINAADMARALVAPGAMGRIRPLMKELRLYEDKSLPIQAKTGTLNFVSGLAGYFDAGGRPMAFAIFAADTARRAGLSVGERERPEGGQSWGRRARNMQFKLIERWARVHA
ncbi:D-alanyl-D-alanine carboxypeptidase [Jannaschia sp. Os4]|uniref:D-alanyl-D-alanine carboxypeptidase n=1 Tax=Jannaschia sp. Os4 TaxID=2807617 RepID=UPI001939810D|nr:D-alanyl-D-alanine carboxypeptidase [Jannaschia sp. Os4]MBM2575266.1 D-alanyl-D-alanine carboxypeptidase [Jannaschia sp. Os4]